MSGQNTSSLSFGGVGGAGGLLFVFAGYMTGAGRDNSSRVFSRSNRGWVKKDRPYPDSVTDKVLWLLRYHNGTMNRVTEEDWRSLSDDDYTATKEDFIVTVPDHPVFKEYELIVDASDDEVPLK